jgi:hypothetical protein
MAEKTNANIYNIYKQELNSLSITKIKKCTKYNSNAIAISCKKTYKNQDKK